MFVSTYVTKWKAPMVVSRTKFTRSETDRVPLRETKSWDEPRLSDLNNGWADWIDNKLE